jgi:TetR/AcrR family transcriptional repressor of nem operon
MGRHREFDPEAALEAAMNVFWQKGYAHTSIEDLLEAMNINRWSMYQTFGDKQQLFAKALTLYRTRWAAFIREHLNKEGSPRAALMGLIRAMGDQIVADRLSRGCLIANSSFELDQLEPEAALIVTSGLRNLEDALTNAIARAQSAGEITPTKDARTLARFLMATVNGIRSAGKVESSRGQLMDLIETALSVLH